MRTVLSWLAVWLVAASAAGNERLVVFVDVGGSALQERFVAEQVPGLEALGEELGVAVELFDVAERGHVPEGVSITPLIAFQNWRGTSIYQGRYTTLDRVRNFVRTSRFMPQGEAPFVRENVPVWDREAMKVAIATKITDFVGPGVDNAQWITDSGLATASIQAIESASAGGRFAMRDRVELGRSDRTWYVDLYPYVAEDGTVFVSSALFSQFHCHEPVTSWTDEPTEGTAAEALVAAMIRAETEINRQITESELGDGFDVVGVPSVSWAEAGLALPEKPAGVSAEAADIAIPGSWIVDTDAQEAAPAVQFTWPPPVDAYSGEATKITGAVELGGGAQSGWTFAGLTGSFTAEAASVTMGESDLDAFIHGGILQAGEHPEPAFVIESVDVEPAFATQPVRLGELVPITLTGTYTMLGQSIPLTVPMSAEVFLGEDGRPRLSLTGQWNLPLNAPWQIEGPPGPKEASSVMVFACRIVIEPSED
ncbi:MAG: YceI family protein [Planctomycetota bacterium]